MVGNMIENNMVTISGKVVSDLEFSHEVYGEGFYIVRLEVPRLSESSDIIPVTVSERLISKESLVQGTLLQVEGQFRSYNSFTEEGNRLILTVFAREIVLLEELDRIKNLNQIYLNGYICKKPVYRTTPFGREISDILLAVNRPYNKSDYIPCIAWGRNARYCQNLCVGDNLKVWGRIQSRTYQKKLDSGEIVDKTAYEVSISKMEVGRKNSSNASHMNQQEQYDDSINKYDEDTVDL